MTEELLAIENHHVDREHFPDLTIKMTRKEHQKIHNILPIDTPLTRKVREYIMIRRIMSSTKNWITSYKREFDDTPDITLTGLRKSKKKLRKEIAQMVQEERAKVPIGEGLYDVLFAEVIAFAHPKRFSSCRQFLHFCGYTQSAKVSGHYRRDVHSTGHEIAKGLIMKKDEKYYPLYLKIKEGIATRLPWFHKIDIDQKAKNRIATLVFKEIYKSLVGTERS